MDTHCLKCKKPTGNVEGSVVQSATGRSMLKTKCVSCGGNKSRFLPAGASGGDLQQCIVSKFPDTELHLPVVTKKGLERASFAGPGTKLEERIENLQGVLDDHEKKGHTDPTDPRIKTKPKTKFDGRALQHDLSYTAAQRKHGSDKKALLKAKHSADKTMIKGNVIDALDPTNNIVDRVTSGLSAAAFTGKVALGLGVEEKKPRRAKK